MSQAYSTWKAVLGPVRCTCIRVRTGIPTSVANIPKKITPEFSPELAQVPGDKSKTIYLCYPVWGHN